jgi:hypothetical protein
LLDLLVLLTLAGFLLASESLGFLAALLLDGASLAIPLLLKRLLKKSS